MSIQLLQEQFSQSSASLFLIDAQTGLKLTYGECSAAARDLAQTLSQLGVKQSSRVGILLENCPEFLVSYLACIFMGAVAVPINVQLGRKDRHFILQNSGLTALICGQSTYHLLEDFSVPSVCVTGTCESGLTWRLAQAIDRGNSQAAFKSLESRPDDHPQSINFTSGTTGLPKGVVHSLNSLCKSALAFNEELGFSKTTRIYHNFPMSYMAGFLNTFICPMLAGGSIVIGPQLDPKTLMSFWNHPIKYEANTLWLVPTILASLLKLDRGSAGTEYCSKVVKSISVGTAPLAAKIKREFESRYGITVFESYGLSETLFVTSNSARQPSQVGCVGRLLKGVVLRFNNDEGGPDEDGEIEIQSAFNMVGYLDYQSGTINTLPSDTWFKSGDIGFLDDDGLLHISGRKKDLIIRGGINVSPRAVEELLLEHPLVADAAVVGAPNEILGEEVVAVIELKTPSGRNEDEAKRSLSQYCKEHLSPASLPTRWVFRDQLPKTSNGKINKVEIKSHLDQVLQSL